MRIVALVPARGGSKRVPRKNLALVGGRSLIAWSIEAALQAPSIDQVLFSTDDLELADAARELGANVPFLRPPELASDGSTQIDVILHALDWLKLNGGEPDYLMLLQPTSPFRGVEDMEEAVQVAARTGAESVVSVAPVAEHPMLMFTLEDSGAMSRVMATPDPNMRTQDMPDVFVLNGAVYLFTPTFLRRENRTVTGDTRAYVMPRSRSLDVDTVEDLEAARREAAVRGLG